MIIKCGFNYTKVLKMQKRAKQIVAHKNLRLFVRLVYSSASGIQTRILPASRLSQA